MTEDFMKFIDDELDKGKNPRRIEVEISKFKLNSEDHEKAKNYLDFKIKHFGIHKKVKKNATGLALSLFFILIVSGLFSTGIFFSVTEESEVEMFSPPLIEEEKDLREFNVEPLTRTGKNFNMDVGMTRSFFYNNQKYSLSLLASGKNYADLKISVNDTIFTAFYGREQELDLNLDGEQDIAILLINTEYEKANLKVTILEKEADVEKVKVACTRDEECDDDDLQTYDICDSENKFCINKETVACLFNEDCTPSGNLTVRCVKKRGRLPFCEYLQPNKCETDKDCDDGNFTTEDICIVLPTSTNYCQYSLIEEIDCGKTKDIVLANKTEKANDETVKCFNNYLKSDFDVDIRYMFNETRIDVEISRLKNDKSKLYVEFEKTPYSYKEFEDEYFECEFKDGELINFSKATKTSKIDAIEFLENVFNEVLEDQDLMEEKNCVGNLNSPPIILNIPDFSESMGIISWHDLDDYIFDEDDKIGRLSLELRYYNASALDLDISNDNQKMMIRGLEKGSYDATLIATDTNGESSSKIFKIIIN
ncbi:hypothetical protein KY321_02870 [Candidatus Woesearchaeota archaeon]|nr:hypothetical protein [Candidatus Woesearchaeota archaeon]